jgi:hypothetical protein
MTTRKQVVAALQLRYGSATFSDRMRILDEFVALTGYHRKHPIRLLREKPGAAMGTDGAIGCTLDADAVVRSRRPGLRQATEGVDPEASWLMPWSGTVIST